MSVVINHEAVERQLTEIAEAKNARDHASDVRRRRAIDGLSVIGLLGDGARELYRREYLKALPTARYRMDNASDHWETTMSPKRDSVSGGIAGTSANAAAMALGAVGGERRAEEHPWLSVASAGFLTLRAVLAGRQLLEELEDGELDVFTTFNAVTTAAAVPLAVPEAVRAIRGLFNR
jgi:hypothetical protein